MGEIIYLIGCIIVGLWSLTGTVINAILMITFIIKKQLRSLSIGYLIIYICLIGALTSASYMSNSAVAYRNYANITISRTQCYIENFGRVICKCNIFLHKYKTPGLLNLAGVAKYGLLMISIDRVMAVRSPLAYKTRNHKKYALMTCVITAAESLIGAALMTLAIDFTGGILYL
jgi:hypothetical protein